MFAALLPIDRHVDRWVVDHQSAAVFDVLAPFREQGPLTSLVTARQLLPISAALVLGGVVSGRRGLREAGWGCASALAVSNTVRYAVYALVARPRPSVAEGDQYAFRVPGGGWNEHSFIAGHATNAFACTSFWNERFDNLRPQERDRDVPRRRLPSRAGPASRDVDGSEAECGTARCPV